MIKRYVFNAPANHQLEAGGVTVQGGEEIDLDEALVAGLPLSEVEEGEVETWDEDDDDVDGDDDDASEDEDDR
jgi:hypothetical protein